ncbi:MAG: TIGR04438 family Trp-rich protein [Rubrivivax sp.]|nr:TIGR04438 family Trp-rich protein [Rubrivivax sp.]
MPLVIVGTLLLIAHLADFGPFGSWPWWAIAAPFAGAVLWWSFADNSGWTQRRVMDKMERKKAERREKAMVALGLNTRRERGATRSKEDAARHNSPPPATPVPPAPSADPTRRDPRL